MRMAKNYHSEERHVTSSGWLGLPNGSPSRKRYMA